VLQSGLGTAGGILEIEREDNTIIEVPVVDLRKLEVLSAPVAWRWAVR
jgi:hypothetical protein